MKDFVIRALVAGGIMGVVDFLWLSIVAKNFYKSQIGPLLLGDCLRNQSAAEFWQMSDAIWHQKPPELKLACFSLGAKMPVEKARDTLNEVLAHIDEKLVVSGIDKVMQMEGPHSDDKISFNPGFLASPAAVHIGTYNWDDRNTWRYANVDGVVQGRNGLRRIKVFEVLHWGQPVGHPCCCSS